MTRAQFPSRRPSKSATSTSGQHLLPDEGTGWEAQEGDKKSYQGDFNPGKDWVAKSRGELRVLFEGDEKRTLTVIKALMDGCGTSRSHGCDSPESVA